MISSKIISKFKDEVLLNLKNLYLKKANEIEKKLNEYVKKINPNYMERI